MPRLEESRPALVSALIDLQSPSSNPRAGLSGFPQLEERDLFPRLARAVLGLIAEPRLASSLVAAFDEAGLLDPASLVAASSVELEEILNQRRIKFPVKSLRPLLGLARWASEAGVDAERVRSASTEALRESWIKIRGLGPAMVDGLLLVGLNRAAYPVDRATYRVLLRHGWIDPTAEYEEARSVVESLAPEDPARLVNLASAFAILGREYCKPTVARCETCPLREFLPVEGPREMD